MKKYIPKKSTVTYLVKSSYWFLVGFILMAGILSSTVLFYFQYAYKNRVIPGVFIDNVYIGEKTKPEIEEIFDKRNENIGKNTFILAADTIDATVSAKTLKIGYDTNLITEQSLSLGKTKSLLSDIYIILSSYVNGTFLDAPYTFDDRELKNQIAPIKKLVHKDPIDAQFSVEGNKVVSFQQSENGKDIDSNELEAKIKDSVPTLARSQSPGINRIVIKVKTVKPKVTTEEANDFGVVEQIGYGTSTFYHSIPGRIHNVALAASKLNGILVPPGEEFSFVKYLGDVSKFTGYKEAYVIQNGRTVLGDGGGVCQVSTTLFRAILNAGLPITERHAHAYRVGYYEQDAPPGLDATVYVPSVDLKFKNDTGKHILIQSFTDTTNLSLTFILYGTKDGREVTMTKPVLSNIAPAPPDLFQDDPNLPAGTVKQVDFAASGARSVFTRTVKKNGKVIINDTFTSSYRPWQAVFLKGTKT